MGGIEADLILLLNSYRSSGRKINEAKLYSIYANFLEASGRFSEAIAMRREAVRLMRSFDLFATLPEELARLSLLISRTDPASGAAMAAEAKKLASRKERIPPRIAKAVLSILSKKPLIVTAQKSDPSKVKIDLQPVRSLVIPIEGHPVRGRLSLSNPTSEVVTGTLIFAGMPVDAFWDATAASASVTLGKEGADHLSDINLEPGAVALIDLFAPASAMTNGTLTVTWSCAEQGELRSVWTIDEDEKGASSAVIDAGDFRGNPYYGLLVNHHYMQPADGNPNVDIRVTASEPTRVELYDGSDRPIFIDANGDGSLADAGDSLFVDETGDGSGDIPAKAGEAPFCLLVYPPAKLPADGINLTIEVKIDGHWVIFAEDHILP